MINHLVDYLVDDVCHIDDDAVDAVGHAVDIIDDVLVLFVLSGTSSSAQFFFLPSQDQLSEVTAKR